MIIAYAIIIIYTESVY